MVISLRIKQKLFNGIDNEHTLTHCSAKSRDVRCERSAVANRLHSALMAPSTATTRRVHSAETSR